MASIGSCFYSCQFPPWRAYHPLFDRSIHEGSLNYWDDGKRYPDSEETATFNYVGHHKWPHNHGKVNANETLISMKVCNGHWKELSKYTFTSFFIHFVLSDRSIARPVKIQGFHSNKISSNYRMWWTNFKALLKWTLYIFDQDTEVKAAKKLLSCCFASAPLISDMVPLLKKTNLFPVQLVRMEFTAFQLSRKSHGFTVLIHQFVTIRPLNDCCNFPPRPNFLHIAHSAEHLVLLFSLQLGWKRSNRTGAMIQKTLDQQPQ